MSIEFLYHGSPIRLEKLVPMLVNQGMDHFRTKMDHLHKPKKKAVNSDVF